MRDAPLDPLGRKLANPLLHILQSFADDPYDIDPNLGIVTDQFEQLRLAPTRFERLGKRHRLGGVSAVGEQSNSPEHFTGTDEADHNLGAVAARLGNSNTALD